MEYSTAKPSVAKIWMKNSAAVPSGAAEKRRLRNFNQRSCRSARPVMSSRAWDLSHVVYKKG